MTDISIGSIDDLPVEAGRRIDAGSDRIAVFRIGDDVYAIGDRCSHAEASLAEGEVFDTEVECPRHERPSTWQQGCRSRSPQPSRSRPTP